MDVDQWYAGIEKAQNGYIIRYNTPPDEDGDVFEEVMVLEEKAQSIVQPITETNVGEVRELQKMRAFAELIDMLRSHFAVPHARNGKYYLRVQIMKRHHDGGSDEPVEEI